MFRVYNRHKKVKNEINKPTTNLTDEEIKHIIDKAINQNPIVFKRLAEI